jgi:hypothetical protein
VAPPIGPLVLTPSEPADRGVRVRRTSDAAELCTRRLDWIEAGA